MIRIDLIYNLSVLVSLSVISSFISFKIKKRINILIFQGILFGFASVIGMMYPVVISKGLIFDGRTIVISLASLFFGPITGGIATLLALAYRTYIGGIGIIMGLSTIIESYLIGTIFYLFNKKKNLLPSNLQIYIMGIIVHIIMILLILTLPKRVIVLTYKNIAPTVIIFYPIITLFIGRILLDQIQRRAYYEKLHDSEFFFRTIFNSLGEAVIITDIDLKIQKINHTTELLLNTSEDDVKGIKLFDVIKIENETNLKEITEKDGELSLFSKELILLRNNNKNYVYCTLSTIKNQNNELNGYIFIIRDITEQKQKQLILDELNIKFNILFNSMKEAVSFNKIIYNKEGTPVNYKITDCNSSFVELIKLKKEEIIDKTATSLFQEKKPPYLKKYFSVIQTQKPLTFEAFFKNLNKYFIISAVFINENEFGAVYLDITKIKLYEKALIEKQKELEEYLYATSHDLRSPLVNIHGFTEILREKYEKIKRYLTQDKNGNKEIEKIMNEDIPMAFRFISESAKKMDMLITGILQISKTEKKSLNIEEIDMNKLIHQVMDNFKFIINKISAKVTIKNLPSCFGDKELFLSLFSNLIDNSIKYKDKNRKLEIVIDAEELKDKVIYKVSDNGTGIDEKYIDKIWSIYYRIETDLNQSGQGIGLSIAKKIVQRNNGRIWVKSKKGIGTTFFIEFNKTKFRPHEIYS